MTPIHNLVKETADNKHLLTQKKPVAREDFTDEEFKRLTDGCGSKSFRPWMHSYFEDDCRIHDFLYQSGYTETHRIIADIILFMCMLVTAFKWVFHIHIFVLLIILCPIYFLLLLFSGWYTFSRFHIDGSKQKGYASKRLMTLRMECRKEELNPLASYNERRK